ncbi:NAD(P)/FAD-dependent oxidoreductase [Streptomyces sp. NPDC057909]|uniref:NAD(P)/FAD-dependent oxidoreductase n=1 Tax=Streptomyces sp. NPDC057909 TaxID=3346277 RepID=UPI0036DFC03F
MTDIAVIGAGVVGLSTAWLLAEAGLTVTVLDSGTAGSGVSRHAHGEIVPPAPAAQPLWRQSLLLYQRLSEHGDFEWDPEPVGTAIVADHGAEDLLPARKDAVPDGHVVDAAGLCAVEPSIAPSNAGALLLAEGRRLNPRKAVAALARCAGSAGAMLHNGVTVVGLHHAPGMWHLQTSDGSSIDARRVVVAAGFRSPRLVQDVACRIPLVGVRGRILLTEPLPPMLTRIVSDASAGAAALSAARTTMKDLATRGSESVAAAALLHQRPDGRFAIGSSWAPSLWPEDPATARHIAHAAVRRVPALADAVVEDSWSDVRPCSVDGRPIIDEIAENLYVCCGHGGEGFMNGPGSAELLTRIVLGHQTGPQATAFSARRFTPPN